MSESPWSLQLFILQPEGEQLGDPHLLKNGRGIAEDPRPEGPWEKAGLSQQVSSARAVWQAHLVDSSEASVWGAIRFGSRSIYQNLEKEGTHSLSLSSSCWWAGITPDTVRAQPGKLVAKCSPQHWDQEALSRAGLSLHSPPLHQALSSACPEPPPCLILHHVSRVTVRIALNWKWGASVPFAKPPSEEHVAPADFFNLTLQFSSHFGGYSDLVIVAIRQSENLLALWCGSLRPFPPYTPTSAYIREHLCRCPQENRQDVILIWSLTSWFSNFVMLQSVGHTMKGRNINACPLL